MANFQRGDVVVLKSGGPKMTVEDTGDYSQGMGIGPKDGVSCIWFDKTKRMNGVFDAATLEKAPPAKP